MQMMRVYDSSHAIVKALAGVDNKAMIVWLDDLLRAEATERGLILREEEKEGPFKEIPKELIVHRG